MTMNFFLVPATGAGIRGGQHRNFGRTGVNVSVEGMRPISGFAGLWGWIVRGMRPKARCKLLEEIGMGLQNALAKKGVNGVSVRQFKKDIPARWSDAGAIDPVMRIGKTYGPDACTNLLQVSGKNNERLIEVMIYFEGCVGYAGSQVLVDAKVLDSETVSHIILNALPPRSNKTA